MADETQQITVRTNGLVLHHPPGATVTIEADAEGTPLDYHWRRRLRDGDCERIETTKASKRRASKPAPAGEEGAE